MLLHLESMVLFVNDIDAAAAWYAALLGVRLEHENPRRNDAAIVLGSRALNVSSAAGAEGRH
jgi:catechol 2,3-dioxygenase-like lactoylglutathione lyase family enzyme